MGSEISKPLNCFIRLGLCECYDFAWHNLLSLRKNRIILKFYCSLPWSNESIVGYVGEIIADIIIFDLFIFIVGHLFLLFISLCIHLFAFNRMYANFVNELDNANDEKDKVRIIRKVIEFHVDIKGCVTIWCNF